MFVQGNANAEGWLTVPHSYITMCLSSPPATWVGRGLPGGTFPTTLPHQLASGAGSSRELCPWPGSHSLGGLPLLGLSLS
jgi:hypothetical protein